MDRYCRYKGDVYLGRRVARTGHERATVRRQRQAHDVTGMADEWRRLLTSLYVPQSTAHIQQHSPDGGTDWRVWIPQVTRATGQCCIAHSAPAPTTRPVVYRWRPPSSGTALNRYRAAGALTHTRTILQRDCRGSVTPPSSHYRDSDVIHKPEVHNVLQTYLPEEDCMATIDIVKFERVVLEIWWCT